MGQFEWESSNLHIAYPFERPGIDWMNDVIVDAVVLDSAQAQMVYLTSLSITDWTAAGVSATLAYEDSSSFFDETPSVAVQVYGPWVSLRLSTTTGKEVQLLVNGAKPLPISISGMYKFVGRVQEDDPDAVRSIEVTDGVTSITHVLSGDVQLSAGYNVQAQPMDRTFTDRAGAASVELSAVPGAGLGVAPSNCTSDAVLRSLNTVGPDKDGKFTLSGLSCYRCFVPNSGSPAAGMFDPLPAAIKLCNDCAQCCKCADYENTYKAMSRLHQKGRNSGLRLARTIDDFDDLRGQISYEKARREVPSMELLLRPAPGFILGVQINLLNNSLRGGIDMSSIIPLLKMIVTSDDLDVANTKILPESCYLFNSAYGNPWLRMQDGADDIMKSPQDFSSPDGIEFKIKEGLVVNKHYHYIKTTQFLSIFFELFWPSNVSSPPTDGDVISVKLESRLFKPYTLTKTEKILEPFTGIVE
jgi:hypothetical protein